jgi:hypothetical protein
MGLQVGLGMDGDQMGHMDHGGMGLKHYVLRLTLPMHQNPHWATPKTFYVLMACHVLGFTLPMHQNPHQVALKQMTHVQCVT